MTRSFAGGMGGDVVVCVCAAVAVLTTEIHAIVDVLRRVFRAGEDLVSPNLSAEEVAFVVARLLCSHSLRGSKSDVLCDGGSCLDNMHGVSTSCLAA